MFTFILTFDQITSNKSAAFINIYLLVHLWRYDDGDAREWVGLAKRLQIVSALVHVCDDIATKITAAEKHRNTDS